MMILMITGIYGPYIITGMGYRILRMVGCELIKHQLKKEI